jgi:hypothetical protein
VILTNEDFNILKRLEESLWISDTRFDPEYMDRILSPDFFEFGRSGRIYKREEILSIPCREIRATLPLQDFAIHPITEDVVLVTYVSKVQGDKTLEVGNRSSLWHKTNSGWQLQFHQGTPVKLEEVGFEPTIRG